jgi:hypothetical protein
MYVPFLVFVCSHSGRNAKKSKKNSAAPDFDAQMLDILKANIQERRKVTEDEFANDDLQSFFRSTYDTVRKLSKANQRLAKRKILELVLELEEKDESEREGLIISDGEGNVLSGVRIAE